MVPRAPTAAEMTLIRVLLVAIVTASAEPKPVGDLSGKCRNHGPDQGDEERAGRGVGLPAVAPGFELMDPFADRCRGSGLNVDDVGMRGSEICGLRQDGGH